MCELARQNACGHLTRASSRKNLQEKCRKADGVPWSNPGFNSYRKNTSVCLGKNGFKNPLRQGFSMISYWFSTILQDFPLIFHRFSIVFHGLQWFSYRIPGIFVLNRLRPGRDRQVQRDTSELRTSLEDAETEVQRVRRLSCGTWTGDGYGWIWYYIHWFNFNWL